MRTLIAIIVAATCSAASAQDYWSPQPTCRTYSVPVSNLYRVTRDPYTGQVYSREYIGTRYEQRTYCLPQPRYHFEPWIHPIQQPHVLSGW